jgi:hypothetical protein
MDTSERLIRFRVVAAYQRNNSKGVSVVIHPDQSMAQMIPNVRSVSIARKIIGLWKIRPAWAIVQYSNGAGWWRRSNVDRPIFITRSAAAQKITIHPTITRKRSSGDPARTAAIPKSTLNRQKGMPIVILKKNGRRKNFSIASVLFPPVRFSFPFVFDAILSPCAGCLVYFIGLIFKNQEIVLVPLAIKKFVENTFYLEA